MQLPAGPTTTTVGTTAVAAPGQPQQPQQQQPPPLPPLTTSVGGYGHGHGHGRRPSLSSTPSYITSGLFSHTTSASTPEHEPSSLGGYFSLAPSRKSSLSRRPSNHRVPTSSPPPPPPPPPQPPSSSGGGNEPMPGQLKHAATFASTASGLSGSTMHDPPGSPTLHPGGVGVGGGGVGGGVASAYASIHELATKRIATLDYLRRAHEGRVFWFNTHLFTRNSLTLSIYSDPKKLAKRARQLFLLGNSLPAVLDLGTSSASDYLRALTLLLAEWETYVASAPGGGRRDHAGSISLAASAGAASVRGVTKLFSRPHKPRRGSSAADHSLVLERTRSHSGGAEDAAPLPLLPAVAAAQMVGGGGGGGGGVGGVALAEEEAYVYLALPALPFDLDYFETFATLCDVLIDAYTKVLMLVGRGPEVGAGPPDAKGGVPELFQKADAKVRRLLVQGVVREFEDACRTGVKRELARVGKEALGGIVG